MSSKIGASLLFFIIYYDTAKIANRDLRDFLFTRYNYLIFIVFSALSVGNSS